MSDLSKRIASLSQEKRKLLGKLLRERGAGEVPDLSSLNDDPDPAQDALSAAGPSDADLTMALPACATPDEVKAVARRFYNAVTAQLDSTESGPYSYFLNFGYVADHNLQQSVIDLPAQQLNRNFISLILEVIGTADLRDRDVLDVGCGRGGTVFVVNKFFQAARTVGVDLSPNAIAFCTRTHRYRETAFEVGDAEDLSFDDESFDVVTNIESSHSYPDINAFYRQVHRVLRPGGDFLYTDVLPTADIPGHLAFLRGLGFSVERNQDITSNVLLSCDASAARHAGAFRRGNDPNVMSLFLGTPESATYSDMQSGTRAYKIFRLRKG